MVVRRCVGNDSIVSSISWRGMAILARISLFPMMEHDCPGGMMGGHLTPVDHF